MSKRGRWKNIFLRLLTAGVPGRRRYLLLVILLTLFAGLKAQDWTTPEIESLLRTYIKQWYEVEGRVFGIDDFEPEPYPLQGANIKVTCMGDTTVFDGTAVDKDGGFWVSMTLRNRLRDTRLRVTISYLGMQTLDSVFVTTEGRSDGVSHYTVVLDSIVLRSHPITTEEVEIIAELQRMYQRGDTIIFNADAYEMPSGSVLLDLVRRLPGLKYEEGKMRYLGRIIEEIRLNGESFFERDMSIALNNMPTDKIKNLKVYEVPDDTLNVMSDNHLIMDMETKEPMDRTLFANISAGTTEKFDRYSLLLNGSVWKTGGSEVYGNFNRSNIPDEYTDAIKSENTNSYFYVNKKIGKTSVSGSVSYNDDYSESKNSVYNKTFLPSYTQNRINENTGTQGNRGWTGSTNLSGRIKEDSNWNFNVNMSRNTGNSATGSSDSILNEGEGLISVTRQSGKTDTDNRSFNINSSFTSNFGESKRYNLNFYLNVTGSDNENTTLNSSENRFLQLGDSVRLVNHRILTPSEQTNCYASLSLQRDLSGSGYASISYNFSRYQSKSIQNYEDILDGTYGTVKRVDSLYYERRNGSVENSLSLDYFYSDSLIRTNISGQASPAVMTADNDQFGRNEHIRYSGIRYNASANFRAKVFKKNQLGFNYRFNNQLPSATQLSTVSDYRDPMNISEGNKNLKNEFRHNFGLEFQFRSWMRATVNYGKRYNAITNLTRLERETGVRRTSPANINGNWNMSEYLYLTYPFSDISVGLTFNHSLNHNVTFVQSFTDSEPKKNAMDWNRFSTGLDVGYSNQYWLTSLEVNYSIEKNKSNYIDNRSGGKRITADAEVSYETPFGLGASTTCRFSKPFGYEMASANQMECIWNVSASYKFLKEKRATLSVTWRDILNSYKGFSAYSSGTSWYETRSFRESSLFVISFHYRFSAFN